MTEMASHLSEQSSFFVETWAKRCAPAFLSDNWIPDDNFFELKEEVADDFLGGIPGRAFASEKFSEITFFQADAHAVCGMSAAFTLRSEVDAGICDWAANSGFAEQPVDELHLARVFERKREDNRLAEVILSFGEDENEISSARLSMALVTGEETCS